MRTPGSAAYVAGLLIELRYTPGGRLILTPELAELQLDAFHASRHQFALDQRALRLAQSRRDNPASEVWV